MAGLAMFLQNRRDILRIGRRIHVPHLADDNSRQTERKERSKKDTNHSGSPFYFLFLGVRDRRKQVGIISKAGSECDSNASPIGAGKR